MRTRMLIVIGALAALGAVLVMSRSRPPRTPQESTSAAAEVRQQLLGHLQPFEPSAPEVTVISERAFEGVQRAEVVITTQDGLKMPAVRLTPPGPGPHPAVLAVHGHDRRGSYLVDSQPAVALRLAKAGFVVLAPTIRSFGDFRPKGMHHNKYTRHLSDQGDVFLRVAVNDARRAFDALQADPHVNPDRVGVLGLSLGGVIALLIAAAEPEIAAAEVAGIFIPLDNLLDPKKAHRCQNMDALEDLGSTIDLALAVAPRPLSIQWGQVDRKVGVELEGHAHTTELAKRAAAEGYAKLETYISPRLGHTFDPDRHIDFFRRALQSR